MSPRREEASLHLSNLDQDPQNQNIIEGAVIDGGASSAEPTKPTSTELAHLQRAAEPADLNDTLISDEERLRQLSQLPSVLPPRKVDMGTEADPFGLLEQKDAYEKLAGLVFTECEGVFQKLAETRPEIGKQARHARKDLSKESIITLPTSKLANLYSFKMVRTKSAASTQYLFHRTDTGYQDKGFRIAKRGEDDHIVISNLDVERDCTENDEEYYKLLHNAKKWIYDYASSMNIDPQSLRSIAELDFKPYGPKLIASHIGRGAIRAFDQRTKLARNVIKKVATVKKEDKARRPRYAAIALAAAIAPIGSHGIASVSAVEGFMDLLNGQATEVFNSHHYQLPKDSQIAFGSVSRIMKFDGTLPDAIRDNAPTLDGSARVGEISKYPLNDTWSSTEYEGLPAHFCQAVNIKMPDANSVRIVTNSSNAAKALRVTTSNTGLFICNVTKQGIPETSETIYVQPEK